MPFTVGKRLANSQKIKGTQLQKLYRIIVGVESRRPKFEFTLWTRGIVQELIKRRFRVSMSEVSGCRMLRKRGLSPQRPQRKSYQQDEYLVLKQMAEDFQEIKKLARKEKAEIFFGDEATARCDYHSGTMRAK